MGFNTVIFVCNDRMHELDEAPHYTAFKIAHPPMSEDDAEYIERQARSVADEHGERWPTRTGVEVMPTFHADYRKFYTAGGNCISELPFVRTVVDRKSGKRCVVLELPDYLQDRKRF